MRLTKIEKAIAAIERENEELGRQIAANAHAIHTMRAPEAPPSKKRTPKEKAPAVMA